MVRLHRKLIEQGKPYKIHFVSDPVCWTEAPECLPVLRKQRVRWQIGLAESLMATKSLLFNRKGGAVFWLAFSIFLIFECFAPIFEVFGFFIIAYSFCSGLIANEFFLIFMMLAVGLGMLISVISLSLEEVSFRSNNNAAELLLLFTVPIIENLGYRQLNAFWRVTGMIKWLDRAENKWGDMTREASWNDSME